MAKYRKPKHEELSHITEYLQQPELDPDTTATNGIGRHLAELRRSGASGSHDSRRRGNRSRRDRNRNAIDRSAKDE